jgi:hypothetical protein|tara:strand:- start:55100 stop:56002 length:903 start_codon:yes stop_codon:yes gene_type:complete
VFSKSQWITTFVLTSACLGAYVGLRSIPVEACEVVHYGAYINDAGVIEGCGIEEVGFFDLDELKYPVALKLEALSTPRVGEETTFVLQLATSTGRPLAYEDIAVSHTERIHAMIIDDALADYQHLHPVDGGALGSYHFTHTPQRAGSYDFYLDFIPLKTAKRTLLAGSFQVEAAQGSETAATSIEALPFPAKLNYPESKLVVGETIELTLEINPLEGDESLTLDPVMDAYAHLVAFSSDRTGFAHFHPTALPGVAPDPADPRLEFRFSVEEPGEYRVWAQFSVNGVEQFIPFDLIIRDEA